MTVTSGGGGTHLWAVLVGWGRDTLRGHHGQSGGWGGMLHPGRIHMEDLTGRQGRTVSPWQCREGTVPSPASLCSSTPHLCPLHPGTLDPGALDPGPLLRPGMYEWGWQRCGLLLSK